MSPDQWFQLVSTGALVGWVLLVVAVLLRPGAWRERLLLAGGRVIPLLLCAAYAALLVMHWGSAPGGNFNSLDGVATLFSSRGVLLAGWVHFLAFDLLVGRWIVDRVLGTGRPRWLLLPTLPLTFLYGPLGVLLYAGLQSLTGRRESG